MITAWFISEHLIGYWVLKTGNVIYASIYIILKEKHVHLS